LKELSLDHFSSPDFSVSLDDMKPAGGLTRGRFGSESTSRRFLKELSPDYFSYLNFSVSLDDMEPAGGLTRRRFGRIVIRKNPF
jgi:hypothetical protein